MPMSIEGYVASVDLVNWWTAATTGIASICFSNGIRTEWITSPGLLSDTVYVPISGNTCTQHMKIPIMNLGLLPRVFNITLTNLITGVAFTNDVYLWFEIKLVKN